MRKINVFLACLVAIMSSFTLFGCKNSPDFSKYVTELRQNIYYGETENYKVKCFYGFREAPFIIDGNKGDKVYGLTFRLLDKELISSSYTLNFKYKDFNFRTAFKLNEVSNALEAFIELKDFAENSFSIDVSSASFVENVTLSSIVDSKALDYKSALNKLYSSSPSLINNYCNDNGEFLGEIHMRIIVKDNLSYWYIGLVNEQGDLKALLMNANTGEVLAIRNVIK